MASTDVNTLLDDLKSSKLAEIKAAKVSSQATITSRMNLEQTTKLKRLKFILIVGFILTFIFIVMTAIYSAKLEYKDIADFVDTYGSQAGLDISGLQTALCIRYPPLTSWFFDGNSSFPEVIYVVVRDPAYNQVLMKDPVDTLSCLYSTAKIGGIGSGSQNTSAAFLICSCQAFQNITNCEQACGTAGTVSTASSVLNGFNTGMSMAGAGAGFFPPFGMIAGFVAGFCLGFFPSQYPPGPPPSPCIS